jgi:hypothetical protein
MPGEKNGLRRGHRKDPPLEKTRQTPRGLLERFRGPKKKG